MKGYLTMLKLNFKLLLRNKGYLCFLVLLPLAAILFLNIPQSESYKNAFEEENLVGELDKREVKILNMVNTKIMVKAYDASNSQLTDYFLRQLVNMGSFDIYRYKEKEMKEESVREYSIEDMNRNTIAATIYIGEDFEDNLLKQEAGKSIRLFTGGTDERTALLEEGINAVLSNMSAAAAQVSDTQELRLQLNENESNAIAKKVNTVESSNEKQLSAKQVSQSSNIGYSLMMITMAFLFGGVFIAQIVIKEKEDKVMTRIFLTDSSPAAYMLVKGALSIFTVMIQTAIMGVGMLLFVNTDFGISIGAYLYFVFFTGIIFNLLATVIGVLVNSQLSASYIAFCVWNFSALLGGLFFSLETASRWIKSASLLMPQRWVIKSAEMLMKGESGSYLSFTLIMVSIIIVIGCVGAIGAKITNKE